MNGDLRNALEQLKLGIKKRYGTTILRPRQAQALLDERDALRKALHTLIGLCVANKGAKGEFISCRTPKSACELTKQQRANSKTWAAWDAARTAIAPARNEET